MGKAIKTREGEVGGGLKAREGAPPGAGSTLVLAVSCREKFPQMSCEPFLGARHPVMCWQYWWEESRPCPQGLREAGQSVKRGRPFHVLLLLSSFIFAKTPLLHGIRV